MSKSKILTVVFIMGGIVIGWFAGYEQGEQKGYRYAAADTDLAHCWLLAWSDISEKGREYGGVRNVPWDEWEIRDKLWLIAYGGSNSKMDKADIEEFVQVVNERYLKR